MTDVHSGAASRQARGSDLDQALSRFGAVWLSAFGITLILTLAAAFVARASLYELMDRVLTLVLGGLGLAWMVSLVIAFGSNAARLLDKLIYLLVALGLLLPLLWGPILGVVVTAWLTGAAVEYSQVYAWFRIHVAELLSPVAARLFNVNLIDVIWNGFQVVATVVGFVAAVVQLWPLVVERLSGTVRPLQD